MCGWKPAEMERRTAEQGTSGLCARPPAWRGKRGRAPPTRHADSTTAHARRGGIHKRRFV